MRQLTFVGPQAIEFHDVPAPHIEGPEQAIVRPLAVSRCDLDYGIAIGHVPVPGPFPLGHETVAEVTEIGDAVTSVRPGDRVILPFQINCGSCAACLRGRTGRCTSVPKLAAYGLGSLGGGDFGGGLSDLLRVPFADAMLTKLAPSVPPVAAAALGDNAVDGYRRVAEALAREPGAEVLVANGGAPSIALYAVAAARGLGASRVVYVDRSERRTALAAKLGADVVRARAEEGLRIGQFPIVVDCTGTEEGLRFCLRSTEAWGECTSAGMYFTDVPFPMLDLYVRGIRFNTGRIDARGDLPGALASVIAGGFDIATVITGVHRWDEAPKLWSEPSIKPVFVVDDEVAASFQRGA